MKVVQLCPILCDPMDYTVLEILQARILEWVVLYYLGIQVNIPKYIRSLPKPRIKARSLTLQADTLPAESQGKPLKPHESVLKIVCP